MNRRTEEQGWQNVPHFFYLSYKRDKLALILFVWWIHQIKQRKGDHDVPTFKTALQLSREWLSVLAWCACDRQHEAWWAAWASSRIWQSARCECDRFVGWSIDRSTHWSACLLVSSVNVQSKSFIPISSISFLANTRSKAGVRVFGFVTSEWCS